MIKGIKRLRQAIENQRDAGKGEFSLTYKDAEEIADECEDELSRLSWAAGVPAPRDADGEVVPLTTRVMYFGDSPRDVTEFRYNADDGWELYTTTLHTCLSTFNLHRPDSWERLEEDANLGSRDYCEKYRLDECDYNMCMRMLARAKALAKALAECDAKGSSDD